MPFSSTQPTRRATFALLVGLAIAVLAFAPSTFAAPGVSLSKALGTPTTTSTDSGSGFGANEAVDVYFDLAQQVFAVTDGTGAFPATTLTVPASAVPGGHWVTAKGEASHLAVQKSFAVHT